MKPTTRIWLYRILGEYFLTPADAAAYAQNMGFEGRLLIRPVMVGGDK